MSTQAAPTHRTMSDQFERDGFIIMRRLLGESPIAQVREDFQFAIDAILHRLHHEGLIDHQWRQLPFAKAFIPAAPHAARWGRGWRRLIAGPGVFALHRDPALLGVLRELLHHQTVLGMPVFNARPKLPNQPMTIVPWHQDSGYYGAETAAHTLVTAWVPLVSATAENGCMQVVRGSHHHGLARHETELGEGKFLEIADPMPAGEVVTCTMEPGDVLFMHNLAWHRSTANTSDHIRWSIDCRFSAPGVPTGAEFAADFPRLWELEGAQAPSLAEWLGWCRACAW